MKKKTDKQVLKFLGYLKELEVIEAIGVAHFLKVDLLVRKDGDDPHEAPGATIEEKEYDIILSEMIDAFIKCSENKKKMILMIMKQAASKD